MTLLYPDSPSISTYGGGTLAYFCRAHSFKRSALRSSVYLLVYTPSVIYECRGLLIQHTGLGTAL